MSFMPFLAKIQNKLKSECQYNHTQKISSGRAHQKAYVLTCYFGPHNMRIATTEWTATGVRCGGGVWGAVGAGGLAITTPTQRYERQCYITESHPYKPPCNMRGRPVSVNIARDLWLWMTSNQTQISVTRLFPKQINE